MKRKGFTLVELLTVIAILAIILLIASPIILNVLEKAKQNTFKNQVLLYVEGLKQQAVLSGIEEGNIVLPSNDESIDIDVTTINLEIDKNYTGKIRITNNNGKYEYTLIDVTGDGYQANGPINKIVVTKAGNKPDTPTPTYTAYTIGQQVTLKDNSTWYVIENSGSDSDTVTLFASKNIKNDASGWTTLNSESKIAFDEANARSTENNSYCTNPSLGCNMYAANGTTVTEDSTIKKFIDGSVTTYINNSLTSNGGTAINSVRLLTRDEYDRLDSSITNNSTNYWTMTPNASSSSYVYIVNYIGDLYDYNASLDGSLGARPVIVTLKSNIK